MAPNRRRKQREQAERARRQIEATPNVYASVLERQWLKRRLQLLGDVEAVFEYDANRVLSAVVKWDGAPVASVNREYYDPEEGWKFPPLGAHQLSFVLPLGADSVAVQVDVGVTSVGMVGMITSLRLKVGAVTVYEERNGRIWTKTPPNLPLAAAPSAPGNATLPLPARPESEQTPRSSSSRSPWWKFWGR